MVAVIVVVGVTAWGASAGAVSSGSSVRVHAMVEARRLLAFAALPSGSVRLARAPGAAQPIGGPELVPGTAERVDVHEWWRSRAAPTDVLAFITGRRTGGAACGPGSMRTAGQSVRWVQCSFPQGRGFTLRWLWFEARAFHGYTLVRVDAVVARGFLPTVPTGASGSTSY